MDDMQSHPQTEQEERLDLMVLLSDSWRALKRMFWVAIVGTLVLTIFFSVRIRMNDMNYPRLYCPYN